MKNHLNSWREKLVHALFRHTCTLIACRNGVIGKNDFTLTKTVTILFVHERGNSVHASRGYAARSVPEFPRSWTNNIVTITDGAFKYISADHDVIFHSEYFYDYDSFGRTSAYEYYQDYYYWNNTAIMDYEYGDQDYESMDVKPAFQSSAVCLTYSQHFFFCLTKKKLSRSICFVSFWLEKRKLFNNMYHWKYQTVKIPCIKKNNK